MRRLTKLRRRGGNLEVLLLDGDEEHEVVGESQYQDALERLVGGKSKRSAQVETVGVLAPEPENPHDPNAVAVLISGLAVGYLPRGVALTLSARIQRAMRREGKPIAVRAVIVGGWLRDGGDEGSFGVRLYFDPRDSTLGGPA